MSDNYEFSIGDLVTATDCNWGVGEILDRRMDGDGAAYKVEWGDGSVVWESERNIEGAPEPEDGPEDNFRDDVEADADVLRSAGMGTDEDYGYFGDDYY